MSAFPRIRYMALVIGCAVALAAKAEEPAAAEKWAGVDEAVVEKYAEAAGRPARAPLLPVDKGDVLLFCFLLAGAAGGFVAGYSYRALFGK